MAKRSIKRRFCDGDGTIGINGILSVFMLVFFSMNVHGFIKLFQTKYTTKRTFIKKPFILIALVALFSKLINKQRISDIFPSIMQHNRNLISAMVGINS